MFTRIHATLSILLFSHVEELGTGIQFRATCLSYGDCGSYAKKEPLHATSFMACSGGGWIVTLNRAGFPEADFVQLRGHGFSFQSGLEVRLLGDP